MAWCCGCARRPRLACMSARLCPQYWPQIWPSASVALAALLGVDSEATTDCRKKEWGWGDGGGVGGGWSEDRCSLGGVSPGGAGGHASSPHYLAPAEARREASRGSCRGQQCPGSRARQSGGGPTSRSTSMHTNSAPSLVSTHSIMWGAAWGAGGGGVGGGRMGVWWGGGQSDGGLVGWGPGGGLDREIRRAAGHGGRVSGARERQGSCKGALRRAGGVRDRWASRAVQHRLGRDSSAGALGALPGAAPAPVPAACPSPPPPPALPGMPPPVGSPASEAGAGRAHRACSGQ